MKKNMKNYVALACLAAGLVAGATGVAKIETKAAESVMTMEVGAGAYLDTVSGIRFNYTIAGYDKETFADRNFGMLIVPYDYLAKAGISLEDDVADDYVTVLQAAAENYDAQTGTGIPNAPIVAKNLTPTDSGKVAYSIGGILEQNYTREFFGIGFEETASGYVYATLNNNVRSVFEVSNLALNKLHYGEWTEDEEDQAEKTNLENNETTLNTFITEGLKFVYGTATPEVSFAATYVGGETTATVTTTKIKEIDLKSHWVVSDTSGLTRGKAQSLTAKIGEVATATGTVDVLKDKAEFELYKTYYDPDSYLSARNAFFNDYVNTNTKGDGALRLSSGYWQSGSSSNGSSYVMFNNPDSADGLFELDENGWYMEFYFQGNNMPLVEFFGTNTSKHKIGAKGAATGYVVHNGVAAWEDVPEKVDNAMSLAKNIYDTTNTLKSSTYKYGGIYKYSSPFRYGVSSYGEFYCGNQQQSVNGFSGTGAEKTGLFNAYDTGKSWTAVVNNTTTSTMKNCSLFSQMSLIMNGTNGKNSDGTYISFVDESGNLTTETTRFHYIVGLYMDADRKVHLDAKLYKVVDGVDETTPLASVDMALKEGALAETTVRKGYIGVYGALKGDDKYYTYASYVKPYQKVVE